MIRGFLLLIALGLTACGGSAVELIDISQTDAQVDVDAQPQAQVDTRPSSDDASPSKLTARLDTPDVGVDAADEADGTPDAVDASPDAVAPDVADASSDASCTPVDLAWWTCPSGLADAAQAPFAAPSDFCLFHRGMYLYDTTPTPPECLCQETYNCACVLRYLVNPCGDAGVLSCTTAGRAPNGDPGNYLEVTCP